MLTEEIISFVYYTLFLNDSIILGLFIIFLFTQTDISPKNK